MTRSGMEVLIIGGTGLIGAAIAARLKQQGYGVTVVARTKRQGSMFPVRVFDVARATRPEDWQGVLSGIDVVVNCAGALQDGPGDDLAGVHAAGPAALVEACEAAGIGRFIHFSAIGVDRDQPSPFSRTKYQAEVVVRASSLDWVILRPSIVIGPTAYGASALLRGLAALPLWPLMPNTGKLQVVFLGDIVETVLRLIQTRAPSRLALDLAGAQPREFSEIVAAFRAWLGWRPARTVPLPEFASKSVYRLGDLAGCLGWRAPVRSTARLEIVRGATGDPARWTEVTGIEPRSLEDTLFASPASVQERWFARLYFLKPISLVVLGAFWFLTGIISMTVGWQAGRELLLGTPAAPFAGLLVAAGAAADMLVGALIVHRRSARGGLVIGVLLSLVYAITGTVLVPELWSEPLGPLLKIWPILVLHLMTLAVLEER